MTSALDYTYPRPMRRAANLRSFFDGNLHADRRFAIVIGQLSVALEQAAEPRGGAGRVENPRAGFMLGGGGRQLMILGNQIWITRAAGRPRRLNVQGFSLVELLVVLGIIAVLLSISLPALHRVRQRALETVCQNNIYQISSALSQMVHTRHQPPPLLPAGQAGGWTRWAMEFLEERALGKEVGGLDRFRPLRELTSVTYRRPVIFTCPFGSRELSNVGDFEVANYVLARHPQNRELWAILDAPVGFARPWIAGPEVVGYPPGNYVGPHSGGRFNASVDW